MSKITNSLLNKLNAFEFEDKEWGSGPIAVIQRSLWRTFFDVQSWTGTFYTIFISLMGCWWFFIANVYSAYPYYVPGNPHDDFFKMETAIISVFCFDMLLMAIASPIHRVFFVFFGLPFLELAGIIAYFLQLNDSIGTYIAFLKCTLCFFIVRFFWFKPLIPIRNAFHRVFSPVIINRGILIVVIFTVVSNILFGAFMFLAETAYCDFYLDCDDDDGCWKYNGSPLIYGLKAETFFQDIPQAIWWCVVSQFTVGYGDYFPYTPGGKAVGGIYFFISVLMLIYPLGLIASAFLTHYRESSEDSETVKQLVPTLLPDAEEFLRRMNIVTSHLNASREAADSMGDDMLQVHAALSLLTPQRGWMSLDQFHRIRAQSEARTAQLPDLPPDAPRVSIEPHSSNSRELPRGPEDRDDVDGPD